MPAPKNNQTTNDRDMAGNLSTRGITTRSVSLRGAKTFSAENRQVTATISTEAPARVYDWRSGEVIDEVLLMSGVQMPESRQVPMLDDHSRWGSNSVIGSARNIRSENGELVSDLVFSSAPEAAGPMLRVQEGHLTDVSIGYRVLKQERIPKDEKRMIQGREYTGPMRVATSWELLETSTTPIGADRFAKMRSEPDAAEVPGANVTESRQEEKEHMDKLKKLLEARGLKAGASDEEAIRFLETLDESTRTQIKNDAEKAVKDAIDAERKRTSEIDGLCTKHEMPAEFRAAAIKDGQTLEQVRAAILEKLANKPGPSAQPKIVVGQEDTEKFRAAALDGIALRAGLKLVNPAPGHDVVAGMTMRDLARELLVRKGEKVPVNVLDMVGRAMTTSDLPYLLTATANKSLLEGWELSQETWQKWVATGSVNDFNTHTAVRASEFSSLDEVPEAAEYKHGKLAESREQYSILTYGKMFSITRQSVINDDLGQLTETPRKMGNAAARKIGDLVYAVLSANANMGDGVALFEQPTYHKNLAASGAHISDTTLDTALVAMAAQTDENGVALGIRPEFFITGPSHFGIAELFFQSIYKDESSKMLPNIYKDYISPMNRIYEPRITGTEWYLAARKGMTVKLFFLGGNQAPFMDQQNGWTVDGVEYKIRIDAGAKAMDWRGMWKNAGT
jgi:hypothetical protein